MGPTARRTTGSVALIAVLASAGFVAFGAWKRYGGLNPYKAFEGGHKPDPSAEIQAKGVKMRHYEKGKLVGSAEAKSLTVGQYHNRLLLKGIKNGVVDSPQGKMQFAAGQGILQPNLRIVDLSQGVRVKGGDFDVQTSVAMLDGRRGEINAPMPLKGTIGGGQFVADSMVHRVNTDYTRIDRPEYIGKLPRGMGAPAAFQSKVWRFTGDFVTREKGLENADNGWASDGEMVITAPKLSREPKTDVVTATGDAKARATYHSAKADIVADKVVIYQKEKKAVCTGHVVVFVRPKKEWDKPLRIDDDDRGPLVPDIPSSTMAKMGQGGALSKDEKAKIDELRSTKNLREYPMQMAAEEVTYWYKEGERRAIAKNGNPTAYQAFSDGRWRQAWAPEAHYDGEKDLLDLIGGGSKREVHLQNSIEDVTDCFTAKMSTKEEQTENDEYVVMKSPKGHGIDFDDDKAKPAGGTAKQADPKTPPPPGGTPGATTPPPTIARLGATFGNRLRS